MTTQLEDNDGYIFYYDVSNRLVFTHEPWMDSPLSEDEEKALEDADAGIGEDW